MGDRATEEVLKAFEEGKKTPVVKTSKQTLAVDHMAMVTPQQLKKMKELGIIPSVMISASITKMDQYSYILGNEEAMKLSAAKSMINAGLRPVAEADTGTFPFSSPMWNMEKFITRKDEHGFTWGPGERVTRQEALWMYTNWAAYYTGDEKILGTLEPGKLADLVVLDGDYMTVPEEDISEIPVVLTLVGGKVVYERSKATRPPGPRRASGEVSGD